MCTHSGDGADVAYKMEKHKDTQALTGLNEHNLQSGHISSYYQVDQQVPRLSKTSN